MTTNVQPSVSTRDEDDKIMSVTLYLCQWKVPKKQNESNLTMSEALFEKHDLQNKRIRELVPKKTSVLDLVS